MTTNQQNTSNNNSSLYYNNLINAIPALKSELGAVKKSEVTDIGVSSKNLPIRETRKTANGFMVSGNVVGEKLVDAVITGMAPDASDEMKKIFAGTVGQSQKTTKAEYQTHLLKSFNKEYERVRKALTKNGNVVNEQEIMAHFRGDIMLTDKKVR